VQREDGGRVEIARRCDTLTVRLYILSSEPPSATAVDWFAPVSFVPLWLSLTALPRKPAAGELFLVSRSVFVLNLLICTTEAS
jgi:hypothetical protein